MMEKRSKLDVIYIAGMPRSGTTVCGDLLASFDGVEHFGPVNTLSLFRDTSAVKKAQCGCGETVEDCAFWSYVLAKSKSRAYKDLLAQTIEATKTQLGASFMVDSGKRLETIDDYRQRDDCNLIGVVLASRRVDQYVKSRQRHAKKRSNRRSDARLLLTGVADVARWAKMFYSIELAKFQLRDSGIPVLLISPETISGDPDAFAALLSKTFGLGEAKKIRTREFDTGITHTLAGSPSRIRQDGVLRIYPPAEPGTSRDGGKLK